MASWIRLKNRSLSLSTKPLFFGVCCTYMHQCSQVRDLLVALYHKAERAHWLLVFLPQDRRAQVPQLHLSSQQEKKLILHVQAVCRLLTCMHISNIYYRSNQSSFLFHSAYPQCTCAAGRVSKQFFLVWSEFLVYWNSKWKTDSSKSLSD